MAQTVRHHDEDRVGEVLCVSPWPSRGSVHADRGNRSKPRSRPWRKRGRTFTLEPLGHDKCFVV